MTLYELVNKITKEGYIGITQREPNKRRREHIYALRGGRHGNIRLQNAFKKYGELAFEFEVRGVFNSLEELNKAEIEVLEKEKDRLYNLAPGGNAFAHYLESKQKISKSQLKPVVGMDIKTGEIKEYASVTDTAKDGFIINNIGGACNLTRYCMTSGSFSRLSVNGWVWMYKKDFSLQELERRRQLASRGKIRSERPVIGKSLKTGDIVRFKSSQEAGRNGFYGQSVYQACDGSRVKSHKGFIWVFGDIDNPESLLEKRYKEYVENPPKTGPKKWQY